MRPKLSNYNKPRPFWMAVLGDTLVYASSAITGYALFENDKTMGFISLGCGVAGYFFTKLYAAQTSDNS